MDAKVTKFKELDLTLIQQGEILAQFNKNFAKVQQEIMDFITKYGQAAKGATAGIVLQVELKVEDPANKVIGLVSQVKRISPPVMPKKKTFAMGGENDTGQNVLYVGVTGSHEETPNQGILEYGEQENEL